MKITQLTTKIKDVYATFADYIAGLAFYTNSQNVPLPTEYDHTVNMNLLALQQPDVDSLQSDCGIDSGSAYASFSVVDANNIRIVDMHGSGNSSGQIRACFEACGRNLSNNSHVYHQLNLWVDNDGTRRVTVSDAAAWRSALGLADSGWINLPLTSAAAAYNSASTPRYRRCGAIVNLCGAAKPKSDVAAGGSIQIGTLPAGFRPPFDLNVPCQGSGNSVWLLTVQETGQVNMSRYRNGASVNAQCTTSNWLPFNVTFMTA